MAAANMLFDKWGGAWRELRQKLTPAREGDCIHTSGLWRRLGGKAGGVLIQDARYCRDKCLEGALHDALARARSTSPHSPAGHRIPLGLLLFSRHQLTMEQLREALDAQRTAGRGKIGEWLQTLGFASEQQVTAALARQWSCPLLRASFLPVGFSRAPRIPLTLLRSFVMLPVDYVESTATLHIAFGEGIDYSVLYAIERMAGCHTEPCMVAPSLVHRNLQALSRNRGESEVVFDRLADSDEFASIIRSYCARVDASEIRLAACGAHLWVRLLRPSRAPLDLLLGARADVSAQAFFPPPPASVSGI
jgi:hypothetical protein